MSGAGRRKADGSDESFVYEIKDALGQKGYRLTEAELDALWSQAVKEGKDAAMVIEFSGLIAIVLVEKKGTSP